MAETERAKHPAAIAWEKWLASDEGQQCRVANTLAHNTNHYLENRLWRAFMAGANSSPSDAEQLHEPRRLVREFLTIDPAKDVARWCEIEQQLERLVGIDTKSGVATP